VIGAVIFAQAPEFMQQYLQRLGGHLDEARRHLQQFKQAAAQSGLTLDKLIANTTANADPAVAKLGGVMADSITRVDTLEAAQTAILHASLWSRPFVFLRHLDATIARATWSIFQPAVPTTAEGLVYALSGMIVLMSLYHFGLKYPLRRAWSRRGKSKLQPAPVASPKG
jgi:hypothetical protein